MRAPFVRFTLFFVAGMAGAALLGPVRVPVSLLVLWVGLAASLISVPRRTPKAAGLVCVGIAAFCYYQWSDGRNITGIDLPARCVLSDECEAAVSGTLASPVEVDGDKASYVLRTRTIRFPDGTEQSEDELLRVSVRLLSEHEQADAAGLRRGDALVLKGKLKRPEPARNFGGFDYREYLRRQHIHWQFSVKGLDSTREAGRVGWGWTRMLAGIDGMRDHLAQKLDLLFPQEQAGYMKGLVIGIRTDVDPEQYGRFSDLGLTHLLAISGLHVAVFVAAVLWLTARIGMTRENGRLTAIWLLPFYVLLTGASPSVVRAGIMGILALYAAHKGVLKDGFHLLCAAGIAMLLWNPYYLLDVGCQLSFLVTAGLILFVPLAAKIIPIKNRTLNGTMAVTLVAQAVSFPLTVYYFNQFSLASWAANLLLVPLVSFAVTPLGSAGMLLALASAKLASPLAWVTIVLNKLSFLIVGWMDKIPGMRLIWPSPSLWWIAGYYVLGAALLYGGAALRQKSSGLPEGVHLGRVAGRGIAALFSRPSVLLSSGRVRPATGILLCLLLLYGYIPDFFVRYGTVSFLDVGQGDAILIRTPEGKNLLIDGGGTQQFRKPGEEWKQGSAPYDVGRKLLVPLLKKRGVRKLDALIITHEDTDHIGGLQAVAEEIAVRRILFNGTLKTSASAEKLFRTAMDKGVPLLPAGSGTVLHADRQTTLHFLQPEAAEGVMQADKQNGKSLVFVMEMAGSRFLFTGDMEASEENGLLSRMPEAGNPKATAAAVAAASPSSRGPVDVLKVAHHGSKTSTTQAWLSYWKPGFAVISVGESNPYGHPSPEVTGRLEAMGIPVLRTDQHGEIRFRIGAEGVEVQKRL